MARQLIRCLEWAGHRVTVISDLRAYLNDPNDTQGWARLRSRADEECQRIAQTWDKDGVVDLWFCYHPYYKSPDLIGPELTLQFGIPYVTCEASYSSRRNIGVWAEMQACALAAVNRAAVNLCITERDRQGLVVAAPKASLVRFAPFIETTAFDKTPTPRPGHIVSVGMMRDGDKFQSYRRLAAALALLPHDHDWHLSVAGDGPMREDVQSLFVAIPAARITWCGLMTQAEIASLLSTGAVYVWPGCGEAYGLAYLEAQAAGLPVVAQAIAGVPEVVANGMTGILTDLGDDAAAATAIMRLLNDETLRHQMGQAARRHVLAHHAFDKAAQRLHQILADVVGNPR